MSEPIQATAAPQTAASDAGRDSNGRFTKGNRGGPGNPFARQVAALRKALLDAVTVEDIDAIAKKLLQLAKEGDLAAIKIILAYTIGKPKITVEPDHLDVEEWEHLKATAFMMKDLPKAMGPGPEFPLTVVRNTRPGMSDNMDRILSQCLTAKPEQLEDLLETLLPDPDDDDDDRPDLEPPSAIGFERHKERRAPSTNGRKQPSRNGKLAHA
jgi:hypothetical protein